MGHKGLTTSSVAAPLPAPAPPAVAAPPDSSVSAQELTAGVAAEKKKPANPRAGAMPTPTEQAPSARTPSAPAKSSTPRAPIQAHKAARAPTSTGNGKRKKRRHTEEATTEARQREPDGPGFRVPDETDDDILVATQQRPEDRTARNPRVVTLDDLDSDDFIMALRRDRLFDPVDADDLNVGREDWLRELDSEAEGDEGTVLAEKDAEDESDEESMAPLIDDEPDEPVDFDLKKPERDRLQLEEWEVYDEHHSGDLHADAAPLYEGPIGPTKAALAYADSPLALFYFFLSKELWRRIAEETNTYRLSCVDDIAVAMRTRDLERKKTVPSTSVLTVEEYKTKIRRKHPIVPHELVRFIGLLVARSLEPRRESLSRHWITKVKGALSRGTFGQFLSRDRFRGITRYLHFNNDNFQQAVSGGRAFKIRPKPHAPVHVRKAQQVGHEVLHDLLR
ncbi:unnamed protein product [Phytophthora fragariaefolia]|uniref:Unnamed protein product n=1 Tax=Phytophthora fragariaefolia TaxID=1490495 RepID=A0A9W6XZI0_9STRA|nr:unnamed protein product [Phytophthora fragariaefolia]